MYSKEQWPAFTHAAHNLLMKGQPLDDYKPSIQLAVEPSFSNCYFLQLVIEGETAEWYRTSWLRLLDARKFSDPQEGLKYLGMPAEPTIKKERGVTSKTEIQAIAEAIKALHVVPVLENSGFLLDGTFYTLIAGTHDVQVCYKWHYLPDSWSALQNLAGMIEALNEKLVSA